VEVVLITLIDMVVNTIVILLVVNALLSFAPLDPWHPIRRVMAQLTDPIVQPFRNIIPPLGMFDLSPLAALIVIQIVGEILKILIRSAF
jgi:YggT family protein